eukprot:m51a1_g11243 hypothetical protein (126) ;mRNA; r:15321-16146
MAERNLLRDTAYVYMEENEGGQKKRGIYLCVGGQRLIQCRFRVWSPLEGIIVKKRNINIKFPLLTKGCMVHVYLHRGATGSQYPDGEIDLKLVDLVPSEWKPEDQPQPQQQQGKGKGKGKGKARK